MTEYRYSRQDPAAFREFYMYSPYEGEKFIAAYKNDRKNTYLALDNELGESNPVKHIDFFSANHRDLSDVTRMVKDYALAITTTLGSFANIYRDPINQKILLNLCELLTDSKGSDPKYSKLINDLIGRFETQKILFVEIVNVQILTKILPFKVLIPYFSFFFFSICLYLNLESEVCLLDL